VGDYRTGRNPAMGLRPLPTNRPQVGQLAARAALPQPLVACAISTIKTNGG